MTASALGNLPVGTFVVVFYIGTSQVGGAYRTTCTARRTWIHSLERNHAIRDHDFLMGFKAARQTR